jgi:hypothetical protein
VLPWQAAFCIKMMMPAQPRVATTEESSSRISNQVHSREDTLWTPELGEIPLRTDLPWEAKDSALNWTTCGHTSLDRISPLISMLSRVIHSCLRLILTSTLFWDRQLTLVVDQNLSRVVDALRVSSRNRMMRREPHSNSITTIEYYDTDIPSPS